jgi:hypothetical protein
MKHTGLGGRMSAAVAAFLAILLGSPGATPGHGGESPAAETIVLRAGRGTARAAATTETMVRRRRVVEPDRAALWRVSRRPGSRLRLDLFDDVRVRGVIEIVERRGAGRFSVAGRLEGDGGEFLLAVEEARVSGGVRTAAGRSFTIGTDLDGRAMVEEVDLDRLPECAGPVTPALSTESLTDPKDDESGESHLPAEPDPRDLIDVLVAYTGRAEIAAGGPAAVRALAQRAVDEANLAYRNSGIDTRLRLVWRGRTEYDETLDSHLVHLQRLAAPDDGWMDEIHALREVTGADVVSLFVDDPESAGIGYLMQQQSTGFAAFAFSVVWFFAASNNLSLAHEIGHNQGCQHDRENATTNPVFHDAYGLRFVGQDGRPYRTVMAYLPGLRIPHYSNPGVSFQGVPTGRNNKENNARAINATAVTVANFRPRRHQPGSLRDFDGNGRDDLATFDALDGSWWISLSREGGFDTFAWGAPSAPTGWESHLEGDFDGDGWVDVAGFHAAAAEWKVGLSRGDRFEALPGHRLDPATGWGLQRAGDYDGDGRLDIASHNGPRGEWWVSLFEGAGFSSSVWGVAASPGDATEAVVGDFNGDGRDDLAHPDPIAGEVWVSVSNGMSFATSLWSGDDAASGWSAVAAGDFSADGRDDLAMVRPSDGGLWVGVSTGGAFEMRRWGDLPPGGGWDPFLKGDFNGDGIDDVAGFQGADAVWWVGLSTGNSFTTASWSVLQPATGWTRHLAGDFDGDGRTDVADYLATTGEWWVGRSSGTRFEVSLWGRFVLPRDDVDTDGDGVADAGDCDPTGAGAWGLPGEVRDLMVDQPDGPGGAARLRWPEPAFKGGTSVHYDVLRSITPSNFHWLDVACLETNDGADRQALDPAPPSPILYYLVRAGNACGEGDLGVDSQAVPRAGVSCP